MKRCWTFARLAAVTRCCGFGSPCSISSWSVTPTGRRRRSISPFAESKVAAFVPGLTVVFGGQRAAKKASCLYILRHRDRRDWALFSKISVGRILRMRRTVGSEAARGPYAAPGGVDYGVFFVRRGTGASIFHSFNCYLRAATRPRTWCRGSLPSGTAGRRRASPRSAPRSTGPSRCRHPSW
jgi:hypothetical protein